MKKAILFFYSFICFIGISTAQFHKMLDFKRASTGGYPYEALISDGNYLYGLTHLGGMNDGGTLFKIKPDGSNFTKLFDFVDSTSGNFPNGSLFYDGAFLYGITVQGGTYDKGTIFKIKTDGSGYLKLFDFNGSNGYLPSGTLISDGIFLYGVTGMGGTNDVGTIFKIKPDGTGFSVLMSFERFTSGLMPHGSLFFDGTYLYGMTESGGKTATTFIGGDGTIFKIKTDGTGYVKLLDFTGTNGSYPFGSFISDGNFLYGMTRQGGTSFQGNLFRIKFDGSGFTSLLDFNGKLNGANPEGSLIFIGNYLYGMTWGGGISDNGTIFKIKNDGNGYQKLWEFLNASDGRNPDGSLFFDNTFLYGMTYSGGINNEGVIFKFDTTTMVGIKENKETNSFLVYPNPATNKLIIIVPDKATVDILNINKQIIKTTILDRGQSSIDIENLPSGVYILSMKTDKEIVIRKIIIE